MSQSSPILRTYMCALASYLGLLFALSGCAGFGSQDIDRSEYPPIPLSASQDEYRHNYAWDLTALYYFEQETITYRIITGDRATAINLTVIPCQTPTNVQMGDIRDAFRKIGAAVGDRRRFVEVTADDASAAIDVVVQNKDSFGDVGELADGVVVGRTDLYFPSGRRTPIIRRAVVRLMADQPERSFRRTALHECMHSVGLWGHSRHMGDLLVPIASPIIPLVELSDYDVHTLQADYTRTADRRSAIDTTGDPTSVVNTTLKSRTMK